MSKKKKKDTLHEDLEGFDINVNEFGELESTFDIDKLNAFLDKKVKDKKLPDEPDVDDYDEDAEEDDEWEEE
jgi:hypothetical protein